MKKEDLTFVIGLPIQSATIVTAIYNNNMFLIFFGSVFLIFNIIGLVINHLKSINHKTDE